MKHDQDEIMDVTAPIGGGPGTGSKGSKIDANKRATKEANSFYDKARRQGVTRQMQRNYGS